MKLNLLVAFLLCAGSTIVAQSSVNSAKNSIAEKQELTATKHLKNDLQRSQLRATPEKIGSEPNNVIKKTTADSLEASKKRVSPIKKIQPKK